MMNRRTFFTTIVAAASVPLADGLLERLAPFLDEPEHLYESREYPAYMVQIRGREIDGRTPEAWAVIDQKVAELSGDPAVFIRTMVRHQIEAMEMRFGKERVGPVTITDFGLHKYRVAPILDD